MVKNHLKTIAVPKSWPVKKKEKTFILRPSAGPHTLDYAVSLNFILVSFLKLAHTKKEAIYLVNHNDVLVDGKKRKSVDFPVGLMDTVSIPELKKHCRVILDSHGKLGVIDINEKEANSKPAKITGKHLVKGKTQLNFFDGTNVLVERDTFKVGDTVVLDTKKNAVGDHFKLEKGNTVLLIGGRHIGNIGKIEDVIENKLTYKTTDNQVHETLKKYAFVVGKDKATVTITNE